VLCTWLIDHHVISEMGDVGQVMSDEHRTSTEAPKIGVDPIGQ
jgi:hypothetical protein